eukprot:g18.t1
MADKYETVVAAFMGTYYNTIFDAVKSVGKFCSKDSKASYKFNDTNEYAANGKDDIKKMLETVTEQFTGLEVTDRHFTPIDGDNISCVVVGRVQINDGPWQIFTHSFVLKRKSEMKYYLFVDVFRIFSKDIFEDNDQEEVVEDEVVSSSDTTDKNAESKTAAVSQASAPSKASNVTAGQESGANGNAKKDAAKNGNLKESNASSANASKNGSNAKSNNKKDVSSSGNSKKQDEKAVAEKGVAAQAQQTGPKKDEDGNKSNPSAKQAPSSKAPVGPPKPKSWADIGANLTSGSTFKDKPSVRRPSIGKKGQDGKQQGSSGDKKVDDKSGGKKKKIDQGKKDTPANGINKQSTHTILFVKNIDAMATAKELKDFFNKFGNVKNVEKLKRKPTQEKGTAYITFSSPKSLDKVLDETKGSTVFKGLTINIEAAKASVQAAAQKKNGGNRGSRGKGGKKDKNRRGMKGNNNDNKNSGRSNS